MNNDFRDIEIDAERITQELQAETDQLLNSSEPGAVQYYKYQFHLAKNQARLAGLLNLMQIEPGQNGKSGAPKESPTTRAKRGSGEYFRQFMEALKNQVHPKIAARNAAERFNLLLDVMSETGGSPAGSEGGFITPLYFDGLVHELKRQYLDLGDFFNSEEVTVGFKGWRTIEALPPANSLAEISGGITLLEEESPTYNRIDFELKDYGGFLPVSKDLMVDTPVNIMAHLARWWARKVALRNNALVQALFAKLTPVTETDSTKLIADVKAALVTGLDPLVSAAASIFCNQTGFGLLDVENTAGLPLLTFDPVLSKHEPVVLADALWPNNEDGTINYLIASPELATRFWAPYAMIGSGESQIGWRTNTIEVRGIYRTDIELADTGAGVLLVVTPPES
jgi:HK97 family phage major capsid protein